MIPWIFIIFGALSSIIGIVGLISIIIVLPIKERFEIVYDKEYDYIRAKLDPEVRKHVWREKEHLTRDFIIAVIVGFLLFFAGIYLGFAAQGEGFWFYENFYPEASANQVWDAINEDGQYVSTDGNIYTYYVIVSGEEINLGEIQYDDLTELRDKLSSIRRENIVVLIDSFAVASRYHAVKDILNELGINYIEETK